MVSSSCLTAISFYKRIKVQAIKEQKEKEERIKRVLAEKVSRNKVT